MKYQINSNCIEFNNQSNVCFEGEIIKVLRRNNILFVLLSPNHENSNNLYSIDLSNQKIKWQINGDSHKIRKDSPFEDIRVEKKHLSCLTYDGVEMKVSFLTGEILDSDYTR